VKPQQAGFIFIPMKDRRVGGAGWSRHHDQPFDLGNWDFRPLQPIPDEFIVYEEVEATA